MFTPRRWAVALLLFIGVVYAGLVVACFDRPTSTDAGPDPDISDCCLYFVLPLYFDEPAVCLREHTAPGECRWLTCLGGLAEYHVCVPADEEQ